MRSFLVPVRYDIVFDTSGAAAAGPFTFRYWVNDTAPPVLRLESGAPPRTIWVSAVDAGAGVDPQSATALIDGRAVTVRYQKGRLVIHATPGTHKLLVQVSDYQEAKNMEDVNAVTPNTTTAARTVRVSG